jgi:hypothetical protein
MPQEGNERAIHFVVLFFLEIVPRVRQDHKGRTGQLLRDL